MASYTFASSERTTASGNDGETKAMLHLLNFDEKRDDIFSFAIDCFNDVTGMDKNSLRLYDVQSKAATRNSPKMIGESLVTLFNNFISGFSNYFVEEILFLGGVSDRNLIDKQLKIFNFANFTKKAQQKIHDSLVNECSKKAYINKKAVTSGNIESFLNNVIFVIAKAAKSDYVRPLIKASVKLHPTNSTLEGIFNEIRNEQSNIKNGKNINDVTITYPDEVAIYGRVLRRRDIELLVIQRVINGNPLGQSCPYEFTPILDKQPPEKRDDTIENCQLALSMQMFDKNSSQAFWNLWDAIVTEIKNNPKANTESI